MKDDRLYLTHMLECIQRIETYTREGRDGFFDSPMVQDAVIRNFEIIGEAAKRVSEALREAYSNVPWTKVAAFRDRLIHGYMGVKVDLVWQIIEHELPVLKAQLKEIQERELGS